MDYINNISRTPSDYLPTKRLKDLVVNNEYNITKIKRVKTKFGDKIVLELDAEFDIFMPNKVNNYLINNDENYARFIHDFQTKSLKIKYLGGCLIEFV